MPLLPPPAEEEAGPEAQAQACTGGLLEDEDDAKRGPHEEHASEGFKPEYFVGDWLDNLGHCISVLPLEPKVGGRRGRDGARGRERARPRVTYLAVLSKPGVPDKRFTIAKDRKNKEWTCGNGTLIREESGVEILSWEAPDGRISTWSREGCVYFDEPPPQAIPDGNEAMMDGGDAMMAPAAWMDPCGAVFFMVPQEAMVPPEGVEGGPQSFWEEPASGEALNVVEALQLPLPALPVLPEELSARGPGGTEEGTTLRATAPEFVPRGSAARAPAGVEASDAASSDGEGATTTSASTGGGRWARTPTPSPLLAPQTAPIPGSGSSYRSRASPKMGPAPSSQKRNSIESQRRQQPRGRTPGGTPQPSPKLNPASSPPMAPVAGQTMQPSDIELSEGTTDVQAFGSRLEWAIPDTWGKLSKLPQDFCITSSMFGVKHASNMQLAFYPNGVRAAEPGHCTVALTRGPDCAGIKFEFLVNGRGIGPKVCLGRRYLGDYPKPYDDSEASKPQKVVVCMQVLEILGTPAD